ncbi:MAG: formylglycine-generating enzyme family protein, partial [Halobacteriovoraceae bacterium]|nr:formylglycine-generating enzyme family protein [Halobacteriovoraceae bacterium]
YKENSNRETHQVGSKLKNPYGLFDMHGNVWEWVQDKYVRELHGGIDPLVISGNNRVVRGGGWFSFAEYLRSANRGSGIPEIGLKNAGFRLVRTVISDSE